MMPETRREEKDLEEMVGLLGKIQFFKDRKQIKEADMMDIAKAMKFESFQGMERVMEQGDNG